MTIDELIEKLEKAETGSRELDADIYILTNIPQERIGKIDRLGGCVGWYPIDAPYQSAIDVPAYTASLDAAVALADRVLPGWRWGVTQGNTPEDDFQGNVWPGVQPYPADLDMFGYHKSAPLALCLAILKAVRVHMHPRDREETK